MERTLRPRQTCDSRASIVRREKAERARECSAAKQIPRMNQQKVARCRARVGEAAFQSQKLIRQQSKSELEENSCSQPEQSCLGRRVSRGASCSKAFLPRCCPFSMA